MLGLTPPVEELDEELGGGQRIPIALGQRRQTSRRLGDEVPIRRSPGPGRAPPPRAYRPGARLRSPRPARPGRTARPPPRPDRRRAPTPGAARRLRPAPDRRFSPRASAPHPPAPRPRGCARTIPSPVAAHCPDAGCASSAMARSLPPPVTRVSPVASRAKHRVYWTSALDRCGIPRYRAAMHRSVGTPIKTIRDHGPAAARWYGFVFFGYVPPALLAGREAMSR